VITQDIIAPLFKERLDNPTRIKITRILIVLIGLYILYWGLFYTGEEDIWDYMAVTGAIYFTGAFSLLFGGLYWHRASSTGAVLALLVGVTAVFGLGPVQDYVHTYIPGSIAERNITSFEEKTIKYDKFEEPDEIEESAFRDMVVDFVMTPFEQAKPWDHDELEGWTAVVRGQAGQAQTVEVDSSWADEATARAWPDFEPRAGDTVSFYKPLSGARVGLMTIGFTLFVFILGSVVFPDRKTREATVIPKWVFMLVSSIAILVLIMNSGQIPWLEDRMDQLKDFIEDYWESLWKFVLLCTCGLFAILSVLVIVGGALDVRKLLRRLRERDASGESDSGD